MRATGIWLLGKMIQIFFGWPSVGFLTNYICKASFVELRLLVGGSGQVAGDADAEEIQK